MIARKLVIGAAVAVVLWLVPERVPVPELVVFSPAGVLAVMERKARLLGESADEVLAVYATDVEPIERGLLASGLVRDVRDARTAAWAVVRETDRRLMSPQLIASVLREENPWLKKDTVSSAGAVGWGQIMPFHVDGGWRGECGVDLEDGPTSVCYSVAILRSELAPRLVQAVRDALNAYSGCVRRPGCKLYAGRVMARLD